VFCQIVYLRRCVPGHIRRALDELPETLEETYARSLKEIDKQNWEYAHRLFQCVAAASRPLRVKELAELLAFDFEAGPIPTFLADWRPEDPTHAVLSTCSSFLTVVDVDGSPIIQFTHFSVKEYLTSERLAATKDTISSYHVSMTSAHTTLAQACLGVLLHLDESVTGDSLEHFPLSKYASRHWVDHARFANVASIVHDGIKCLFDPSKSHLSVWVWIYDPEDNQSRYLHSERPQMTSLRATPLHYAAFCGMHDVVTFLIVEHSQDVNARAFDMSETPLHVASRRGHVKLAQVLLEHGADTEARNGVKDTPLLLASRKGHVELVRDLLKHKANTETRNFSGCNALEWAMFRDHVDVALLLMECGADLNAQDRNENTSLYWALEWGKPGAARALIAHGADVNALCKDNQTLLHRAKGEEAARLLLEHGADANALDIKNRTPLHFASENGRVGVARVLLENGADANARDASNLTPLHLAAITGGALHAKISLLLLQYGSDVHARDDKNQTPFMRATANLHKDIMQLLLEHGAKDHRR
jgi:ankyrin repeat protein